jgi:hypothetical protein
MAALLANLFVGLLLLMASVADRGLYVVAFTSAADEAQSSSDAGNGTAAGDLDYNFNSGSEDDTGSSVGMLDDDYDAQYMYYGGSGYDGSYEYYSNNDGVVSGIIGNSKS